MITGGIFAFAFAWLLIWLLGPKRKPVQEPTKDEEFASVVAGMGQRAQQADTQIESVVRELNVIAREAQEKPRTPTAVEAAEIILKDRRPASVRCARRASSAKDLRR